MASTSALLLFCEAALAAPQRPPPLVNDDTCPYPQFEMLKSVDSTPYADACARGFMVKSGSCRGATVFVKAIGIYPSVIDVQVTGKPLAATNPGEKKKRKEKKKNSATGN